MRARRPGTAASAPAASSRAVDTGMASVWRKGSATSLTTHLAAAGAAKALFTRPAPEKDDLPPFRAPRYFPGGRARARAFGKQAPCAWRTSRPPPRALPPSPPRARCARRVRRAPRRAPRARDGGRGARRPAAGGGPGRAVAAARARRRQGPHVGAAGDQARRQAGAPGGGGGQGAGPRGRAARGRGRSLGAPSQGPVQVQAAERAACSAARETPARARPSQVCSAVVDADGLSLRWEDDSKTLQSSIFLRCEVGGGAGPRPGVGQGGRRSRGWGDGGAGATRRPFSPPSSCAVTWACTSTACRAAGGGGRAVEGALGDGKGPACASGRSSFSHPSPRPPPSSPTPTPPALLYLRHPPGAAGLRHPGAGGGVRPSWQHAVGASPGQGVGPSAGPSRAGGGPGGSTQSPSTSRRPSPPRLPPPTAPPRPTQPHSSASSSTRWASSPPPRTPTACCCPTPAPRASCSWSEPWGGRGSGKLAL
jgi:hypothetical protein